MSRAYTAAETAAGDSVVYKELDGVDHMALIDPAETAWTEVHRFLAGLL